MTVAASPAVHSLPAKRLHNAPDHQDDQSDDDYARPEAEFEHVTYEVASGKEQQHQNQWKDREYRFLHSGGSLGGKVRACIGMNTLVSPGSARIAFITRDNNWDTTNAARGSEYLAGKQERFFGVYSWLVSAWSQSRLDLMRWT